MLASLLFGEFLLHIPGWLLFSFFLFLFSFLTCGVSLTHPVMVSVFIRGVSLSHFLLAYFILGVSLTHPMLPLFFCGEFSLYIMCWLLFSLNLGSFSYTSRAGFNFMNGLSLRDPMLAYFYRGSFSYTSRAGLTFIWGVSLTHPVLALIL